MSHKDFLWEHRLHIFNLVLENFESLVETFSSEMKFLNGEHYCLGNDKIFGKSIKLKKRIGSPSVYGEAWFSTLKGIDSKHEHNIAVKKILLKKADIHDTPFSKKQLLSGKSVWSEIAAYILCNVLVFSRICPNLPILYKYTWCSQGCKFVNKEMDVSKKGNNACILIANELADGDINHFTEGKNKKIWNDELIENFIFQVTVALYSLKKYFNMRHNDLHGGNVLVHRIKKVKGYFHYRINKEDYYLPNLGYFFILWDFGMVDIPNVIKSPFPVKKNETDIGNILGVIDDEIESDNFIINDILDNEKKYTLEYIIKRHFGSLKYNKPKKSEIIESYNLDIPKQQVYNSLPDILQKSLNLN